ncbi:hypothetical protein, partial [Enterobacter hormaechei]|uniref:hypothetical protein n=1 Tax=Enterobacter hormaechei TaxID=158836 RepID=UPI003D6E0BB6
CVEQDDKGWDARKRAYCLKIQPATGSFARNLIYSTKPFSHRSSNNLLIKQWINAINPLPDAYYPLIYRIKSCHKYYSKIKTITYTIKTIFQFYLSLTIGISFTRRFVLAYIDAIASRYLNKCSLFF